MSIKKYLFISLLILAAIDLTGQLPSTEIYHFTIERGANGIRLSNPLYLTGFNKDGYNNQPLFFGEDIVYFTTDYYDSTQTEIAKFDLSEKTLTRITTTLESEYSPTPVPSGDGFTCIRVELDNNLQTLTGYSLDGVGIPTRYLSKIINAGYHSWLTKNEVALFLVEPPYHSLAICEINSERRKVILDKIGRCLRKAPNGNLMFVHKLQDDNWYIKSYDLESSQSNIVCKTPGLSEDFELLPDGSILMGNGSQILRFNTNDQNGWQVVQDLDELNINAISRISVKGNRLVLVNLKT